MTSSDPTLRWYAVHTQARAEWMAHRRLREAGYETLYPHYPAVVTHARKRIGVLKPYFPRYLFVRIEDGGDFHAVNDAEGVATVVRGIDGPLVIPDRVIAEIRGRGNEEGRITLDDVSLGRRRLLPGDQVRALSGPLEGFLLTVEIDRGAQLVAWLNVFGRQSPVTLSESGVEFVSPGVRSLPRRQRKRQLKAS